MTAILKHSKFSPATGGHAPGDVRDAFVAAVEAFEQWEDGEPEPAGELREPRIAISAVFGLLWNCSDILPGDLFDQIDDHSGVLKSRTYASAARYLKSRIAGG